MLTFSGSWRLGVRSPSALLVDDELQKSREVRRIAFDSGNLSSWDSTLVAFLVQVSEICRRRQINLDRQGLPAGVCKLLDLTEAVPEKKGARKTEVETTFVQYVGDCAIAAGISVGNSFLRRTFSGPRSHYFTFAERSDRATSRQSRGDHRRDT